MTFWFAHGPKMHINVILLYYMSIGGYQQSETASLSLGCEDKTRAMLLSQRAQHGVVGTTII